MEFSKHYRPSETEAEIIKRWEETDAFSPQPSRTGKTFYIPIPPPNVTGNLHMGHAVFLTLQDIMIRYHRMRGDETIWVPGTDHAAIAAQAVVERKLEAEGKSRREMGREQFMREMWWWMDTYRANITEQIKKMGASVDWSRERFTLDEWLSKIVEETFISLYNDGLIYRGDYMVNYSPALESVVSDIEVEYQEEEGKLYYITYFVSGSDRELTVATTRPETLLGDQAVAVHPQDREMKKLIGKSVIVPIVNREIPIIADEMVDREFGTGAVKITPAHDPADFEAARRHGLPTDYAVIDKNGVMNDNAGLFVGQDALTARENIVELLRAKWNLEKIEPHTQRVGYCSRGKCRIETIVSTQWFVRAGELAKRVIEGYETKEFVIIPDRFNKTFEDWIYNLRDWCISRQLWWGHRIPAYYHVETGELLGVTTDPSELYAQYWQENIRQDDDTLDTWYSSAMWPFGVLDWDFENPSELYQKFYPAQVLETGYDILFFWVIRMLLMGYHFTGQTPFETVYLHGMLTDERGRKMSKSWGNVLDPLEIIEAHSADSVRLTVSIGSTPGNNIPVSMQTVEANTLFLNKLWNIARFVHSMTEDDTRTYAELATEIQNRGSELLEHERWILSRVRYMTDSVTRHLDAFEFSEGGDTVMHFVRDEYADFFVEECKIVREHSVLGGVVLRFVLLTVLRLLHPFIPFISEKIHSHVSPGDGLLATALWASVPFERDESLEARFQTLERFIRSVRNYRAEMRVKPTETIGVIVRANKQTRELVETNRDILSGMMRFGTLDFTETSPDENEYAYLVVDDMEIFIYAAEHRSQGIAEAERLSALIEDKQSYIKTLDEKLLNPNFTKNAPESVVRAEMEKKRQAEEQLQKLREKYEKLV